MALQERKKFHNFAKVNCVSAFLNAANAKSTNPNKLYQKAISRD